MLCPFCLADVKLERRAAYTCPDCREQMPAMYVQDHKKYPPVVVSAVGFRGHGKTVYFASLFHVLKDSALAYHWWPKFYTLCLDEDSLETVYNNAKMLNAGELPDSTPKNFPRPTMVRIAGVPVQRRRARECTLLFYDTGGESFERASQIKQYARFVQRARTVMLFISVPDLETPRQDMFKLLNTYVIGMGELGGHTQDQHLVIVYTKADMMVDRFSTQWENLHTYLLEGSVDGLEHPKGYLRRMDDVSGRLCTFTREELRADQFVTLALGSFRSVEFAVISALGSAPEDGRLAVEVIPRRVLDPLLWMMHKSLSTRKRRVR